MNQNIDNEQVMTDYQTARPGMANRFQTRNPNWRNTIEGRRDLESM